MDKSIKKQLIIKILLALVLISGLIYLGINYGQDIMKLVKNPEALRNLIISKGAWGTLMLVGLQVLQVVVSVIPGEVIQAAGGYVYGFWGSVFFLYFGTLLGAFIAFFLAKYIGYSLVKIFVSKEHMGKFDFLINSKKAGTTMFLLFLMPGIPKDILIYIAGLTPINPFKFFIIFTVARIPGVFVTAYIGANMQQNNYKNVWIAAIVIGIFLVIGLVFKNKIMEKLNKVF